MFPKVPVSRFHQRACRKRDHSAGVPLRANLKNLYSVSRPPKATARCAPTELDSETGTRLKGIAPQLGNLQSRGDLLSTSPVRMNTLRRTVTSAYFPPPGPSTTRCASYSTSASAMPPTSPASRRAASSPLAGPPTCTGAEAHPHPRIQHAFRMSWCERAWRADAVAEDRSCATPSCLAAGGVRQRAVRDADGEPGAGSPGDDSPDPEAFVTCLNPPKGRALPGDHGACQDRRRSAMSKVSRRRALMSSMSWIHCSSLAATVSPDASM